MTARELLTYGTTIKFVFIRHGTLDDI